MPTDSLEPDGIAPPKRQSARGRKPRKGWRFLVLILAILVLCVATLRATVMDFYYVPSGSMENTLQVGDRIAVNRLERGLDQLQRGDVVVFDGRGSFAPLDSGRGWLGDAFTGLGQWLGLVGSDTVFVKRIIGLPGDTVACCGSNGKLSVNGQEITEPYLFPGDAPSDQQFEVTVPANRLWLMGDHRSESADSRSLLGAPGGGMVPLDKVLGRVSFTIWPPERFGELTRVKLEGGPTPG